VEIELCKRCGRPLNPQRVRDNILICRPCEHPDSKLVTLSEHVRRDILENRVRAGSDTTVPPPPLPPQIVEPANLRSRLIEHRDGVMVLLYPNVPRDRGLLRRKMIEALVQHRPTTRAQFFYHIPADLLRGTDKDQIEQSLWGYSA
jgi:hypothetical protein